MNAQLETLADRFLDAWTSQDVEQVLACYTADLVYRDPNTRGDVHGSNAMRRYLTKLFSAWEMTWTRREVHPLAGEGGAVILWHATFRKSGGDKTVEADGMDLVILQGDRASRNEVYFDRSILAPLLAQ